MRERHISTEGFRPPEEIPPISPEDQQRSEETLAEHRAERNQGVIKRVDKSDLSIHGDQADPKQKTLQTRHAGPMAKAGRGFKNVVERFNNATGLRIRFLKRWESNLQENKDEDSE